MRSLSPWLPMPPELHPGALAALRLKLKTYAPKPPAEPPAPVKRGRAPSRKAPATGANDSLQRRIAADVARWLEGLARHQPDLRALPHLGLTVLPDELVEAVADRVLAWADWLLALDQFYQMRPFSIVWRTFRPADNGILPEIGADGEVLIACRESCRACGSSPPYTCWPAHWPEFCGGACAMTWVKDNARSIERYTNIEDELETGINDALDRAERLAKDAAEEHARELKNEWLDSDDNPLLETLRRHYAEPHLDLETALWRMQRDILPKLR